MWSLSQPPGHPYPPLTVCLPRRAERQAGSQAWGSASQGGGLDPGHWGALGNSELWKQLDKEMEGAGHRDIEHFTRKECFCFISPEWFWFHFGLEDVKV